MKLKKTYSYLFYILTCLFFCQNTLSQTPDFTMDLDGLAVVEDTIVYVTGRGFTEAIDGADVFEITSGDFVNTVDYDWFSSTPLSSASGFEIIANAGPVDPILEANWVKIQLQAGEDPVPGDYLFQIDATDEAPNSVSYLFTLSVRRPVSVVMVLDRSGSMGTLIPDILPATTRMDMLKTATSLFVNKLDLYDSELDKRLAFVFFNSQVNMPSPTMSNLTVVDGNVSSFESDINTLSPTGNTAIGDALIDGGKQQLLLADELDGKSLILITDGEQNTGKQVNSAGTEAGGIPLNIPPNNPIQIITIGFAGASLGDSAVNLQNVATNNQGGAMTAHNYLIEPAMSGDSDIEAIAEISNSLQMALESIMRFSSPQTVGIESGFMPAQIPVTKDFKVNSNVDKILFELITSDQEPNFTIEKDNIPVNESNVSLNFIRNSNNGVNSILAIIDLKQPPIGITSEGVWSVNILSGTGGGKPFQIRAEVDDHRLNYTVDVTTSNYRVEDVINVNAQITYANAPIEDATITSVIKRPGDDLGDILARANVDFKPQTQGDITSIGYQKLLALIESNPQLIDSLRLQENSITLSHASNGNYEGQFSNTDVSGIYQIFTRISGSNAEIGDYERLVQRTVYLRFADPDPEESSMQYTAVSNNSFQISYTPKYTVDGQLRFVGPGFANGLEITGADVTNTTTTDNGDGSYNILVTTTGNNDPNIDISLSGVDVYNGPASSFGNGGSSNFIDKIIKWITDTLGIPAWLAWLLLILLILLIIWLIRKLRN